MSFQLFETCGASALHLKTLLIFRSRQCIIAQAIRRKEKEKPAIHGCWFGVRLSPLRVGALCLGERSQTASADPRLAGLALLIDGRLLNVHFELAFGVPHRVADVVPKLRALATDLTFCHWMSASVSQSAISHRLRRRRNPLLVNSVPISLSAVTRASRHHTI